MSIKRRKWYAATKAQLVIDGLNEAKEELLWLHAWQSERELADRLSAWIDSFNNTYLHPALKWKTPIQANRNT